MPCPVKHPRGINNIKHRHKSYHINNIKHLHKSCNKHHINNIKYHHKSYHKHHINPLDNCMDHNKQELSLHISRKGDNMFNLENIKQILNLENIKQILNNQVCNNKIFSNLISSSLKSVKDRLRRKY